MAHSVKGVLTDNPIPPGDTLRWEIESRGMTTKELAEKLESTEKMVNDIFTGAEAICQDTANRLENILGISAQFWVNHEARYRKELAITANLKWMPEYPIEQMLDRGWIKSAQDKPSKMAALLDFLGENTADPKEYRQAVGFRITEAAQSSLSHGALAVWIRKGELEAQAVQTADYNVDAFRQSLSTIKGMMSLPPEEFVPAMKEECAAAGVAFCIVRELPKIGSGVARRLSGKKALIQMSIRGKYADIFWFTFFHEACHLIKHHHRQITVEEVDVDDAAESEANQFAQDFLVPPSAWVDFCNGGRFTPKYVREFAEDVGVPPFIIVGRLQKEGEIQYNQLHGLKLKYKWVD